MINEANAKEYCKEDISKIANYDKAIADPTQTWICHHRTAIWWNCSREELIENECYYGRKACELEFVTASEHRQIHNSGKHHSKETRQQISDSMKGKPGYWAGKTMSDETKHKMSKSQEGRTFSDEHRRKLSEKAKGRTFSEETRRKIGDACKGKSWKLVNGKRVWYSKE